MNSIGVNFGAICIGVGSGLLVPIMLPGASLGLLFLALFGIVLALTGVSIAARRL